MFRWVLAVLVSLALIYPLSAQLREGESLGQIAREFRQQRKLAPKASFVFTNDNIPRAGGISTVGVPSPPPAPPAQADSAPQSARAFSPATSEKPPLANEKDWRNRFATLRRNLSQAQEELAIDQRELGKLTLQYYPNPQQTLMQSIMPVDITKKQSAIDKKQMEIADLKRQLSNLEDDLRKAGGDPGWAR